MPGKSPSPTRKKRTARGRQQTGSTRQTTVQADKKHVHPVVTALVLVPLIGGLVYGASVLLREAARGLDEGAGDETRLAAEGSNAAVDASVVRTTWETPESREQAWSEMDDAEKDGWSTEHFTNQAHRQFAKLKKLLKHPENISANSLGELADPGIVVGALRPENPTTEFSDALLTVKRPESRAGTGGFAVDDPSGLDAFAGALREFAGDYSEPRNLRLKIKVFRVEKNDDELKSRQTVEAFGNSEDGLLEENLTWIATWTAKGIGDKPLLTGLVVEEYERIERPGAPLFSDCTESVIGHSPRFQQQLMQGFNHWLEQTQFQEYYSLPSNPGLAIGDVNNDGLEDLFICQEVGLPCLLYLQQPDGSLKDYTRESNVDLLHNCRSALIVDWDNDGHNDLAVAMTGGVVLAEGDGTGRFRIATLLDTSEDVLVLSAGDYDLDGRLDLFAAVYWADLANWENNFVPVAGFGGAVDARDGGQNSLFRNETANGSWKFRDVTAECGLDADNSRYSQAVAWEDYDNDGDLDLYVANDFGYNNLYRNDLQEDGTRRFRNIAREAGVQDQAAGMSAAWGDFDRDGWMDLYVSNMYSYAGNRITFQTAFKPDEATEIKNSYQRFARGNTFFRNTGRPSDDGVIPFDDISIKKGVNRGRWAWGSRFLDINNDGWEDLVVANGYVTTAGDGDL
jgi:hypothetical protein